MKRKKQPSPITVEEYEQFFQDSNSESFTMDQLNQIIFMHGFEKIHKRPKGDLSDPLSTIDLMTPYRSTTNGNFSPCDSSLSLDQVKEDLKSLHWQECILRSIETVKSEPRNKSLPKSNVEDHGVARKYIFAGSSFRITRKKKRRGRKKRVMMKISSIANDGGAADQGNIGAVDGDALSEGVGARDGSAVDGDPNLYVDTYSLNF